MSLDTIQTNDFIFHMNKFIYKRDESFRVKNLLNKTKNYIYKDVLCLNLDSFYLETTLTIVSVDDVMRFSQNIIEIYNYFLRFEPRNSLFIYSEIPYEPYKVGIFKIPHDNVNILKDDLFYLLENENWIVNYLTYKK